MKKLICFAFFIGMFYNSFSQPKPISHEETMRYINKKLAGKCSLDIIKGVLYATHYENNELVRKDKVKFEALDIKKKGFEDDGVIFFIPCLEEECVERKLLKDNIKKFYSRISFAIENTDEKGREGIMKAFQHIYNLDFAPKGYQRTVPFEN